MIARPNGSSRRRLSVARTFTWLASIYTRMLLTIFSPGYKLLECPIRDLSGVTRFRERVAAWPEDMRDHAIALAFGAGQDMCPTTLG